VTIPKPFGSALRQLLTTCVAGIHPGQGTKTELGFAVRVADPGRPVTVTLRARSGCPVANRQELYGLVHRRGDIWRGQLQRRRPLDRQECAHCNGSHPARAGVGTSQNRRDRACCRPEHLLSMSHQQHDGARDGMIMTVVIPFPNRGSGSVDDPAPRARRHPPRGIKLEVGPFLTSASAGRVARRRRSRPRPGSGS
jgi:hypothetical protein